jgi:hypothetical protein
MPRFTAMVVRDTAKNELFVARILPTIEMDYHVVEPHWIVDAPDELGAFALVTELLERRNRA